MHLPPRFLLMIVLLAAAPLPAVSAAARATETPVALAIRGDSITRLASSSPEATSQVVAGNGLYVRNAGGPWAQTGDAPAPGAIVFAADEPDLLLNGDHPPCLRGGAATPLERSENGGGDWERVEGIDGLRPLAIWRETGIALGATCSGIMLSTDAGRTWSDTAILDAGQEVTAFASIASDDENRGPSFLVGTTSEGGTSHLYRLDLSDVAAPALSDPLRSYWAMGGLAARDDLYVLAAADGVWFSEDAGGSWRRSADGLEDVTLEEDPAQAGLPADVEPGTFGLFAAAFLTDSDDRLVLGSVNGLYAAAGPAGPWAPIPGSSEEVRKIATVSDGDHVLFTAREMVFEVATPVLDNGSRSNAGRRVGHGGATWTSGELAFRSS